VTAELDAAGIAYAVKAARHFKVVFAVDRKSVTIVVSRTPSDHRGALNSRSLVRRILKREMREDNR
jgi:hypothetical protein